MREVISRYSRRNCRTLLKDLALPLMVAALLVGAVIYLAPGIIAKWPSKTVTVVVFGLLVTWATIWAGPLLLSIVLGSIWEDEHIWLEGGRLHVGFPFTRRVQLRDICAVNVGYAPGDVFGRLLTVSTADGRELSFITDVSTEDWARLKEQIETAARQSRGG